MKKSISILLAFAALSCSQLIEVVQEPAAGDMVSIPLTKTSKPSDSITSETIHIIQSNHITMLVNGVVFYDGAYVQTLTEKDMSDLHCTDEEKAFSKRYVEELNAGLKHDEVVSVEE